MREEDRGLLSLIAALEELLPESSLALSVPLRFIRLNLVFIDFFAALTVSEVHPPSVSAGIIPFELFSASSKLVSAVSSDASCIGSERVPRAYVRDLSPIRGAQDPDNVCDLESQNTHCFRLSRILLVDWRVL
jgi:hypothetical protein